MKIRTRQLLARILPLLLVSLCLWYMLQGVDFTQFLQILRAHSPLEYLLAGAVFLLALLPMSWRLYLLTRGDCSWSSVCSAVYFGSGANSLLPARLGDLARAAYLARRNGITTSKILCAVFWERLADLCVILILAMALGLRYRIQFVYMPLLLVIASVLAGALLVRRCPQWFLHCSSFIPVERIRAFVREIIVIIADPLQWPSWGSLFSLSFLVWGSLSLYNICFLHVFFQLPLDIWTGILIGVAGAMGMLLPALPANVGTYEAAIVAALLLAGQDKHTALAAALLLHAVNVIPTTLYAAFIMLRGSWPLNLEPVDEA